MQCDVCQQLKLATQRHHIGMDELHPSTGRTSQQVDTRREIALSLWGTPMPLQVCNRHRIGIKTRRRVISFYEHGQAGFVDYLSITDIARVIGYRDHTTILYFLNERTAKIGTRT